MVLACVSNQLTVTGTDTEASLNEPPAVPDSLATSSLPSFNFTLSVSFTLVRSPRPLSNLYSEPVYALSSPKGTSKMPLELLVVRA